MTAGAGNYRLSFTLKGVHYDSVAECKRKTNYTDAYIREHRRDCKKIRIRGSDIVIRHEGQGDTTPLPTDPNEVTTKMELDDAQYDRELKAINAQVTDEYWEKMLDEEI